MEWRRAGGDRALHEGAAMRNEAAASVRFSRRVFFLAPALMTALLCTFAAQASGLPPDTEDELRSIWARGLPDHLFDGKSRYLANGNAIDALGNPASLLNMPLDFLGIGALFKSISFNRADLSTVVDSTDTALAKVMGHLDYVSADSMKTDSHGRSYGSVVIRDIDRRGTTVMIGRAR